MENQTPDKYERIPRQSFRDLDRKGKVEYVLDYYLLHIIGGLALLAILISAIVYYGFQYRRTQLYAICVDVALEQAELLADDYTAYAEIDTRKYTVVFETGGYELNGDSEYTTYTKLVTVIGAGELDILLYNDNSADRVLQMGVAADLTNALPDALYGRLEADRRLVTGLPSTYEDEEPPLPYTYAIDITDTAFVAQYGLSPMKGERIYLSISVNPGRPEEAARFVEFICGEPDGAK